MYACFGHLLAILGLRYPRQINLKKYYNYEEDSSVDYYECEEENWEDWSDYDYYYED